MPPEKKVYRSRNSWLGGICSGLAEYFNIDPIIVQILTVVLTIATAGVLIIAYVALWIILPRAPDPTVPLEVQPQEVHSDTYGQVMYYAASTEGLSPMSESNFPKNNTYDPYASTAHIPPAPPKDFSGNQTQAFTATNYATAQPVEGEAAQQASTSIPAPSVASGTSAQEPSQTYAAAAQQPPVSALPTGQIPRVTQNPVPPVTSPVRHSAGGALWFGLILLFVGICALLGSFVGGVKWWQFWPLVCIIVGIGQMVVPGKKGHRMNHFVNGLITFSFGGSALPFSLGILSLSSLGPIFVNLWPILVIMCGFLVLGEAMNLAIFTLLAGCSFVAFCVIGLGWFSIDGPTDLLTFTWPNGEVFTYAISLLGGGHGN